MLDDTLAKIQALKAELKKLEAAHAELARRIEGLADAAAQEAGRTPRSDTGLKLAADGLAGAGAELGTTHPKLAAAVSEICRELSSLGI